LAAYVPGSRGRGNTWLQRPRFLAISEFGPGALIYHEGARYQVSRISLPRGGPGETPGEVVRTEARVCDACGYHHPRQPGLEICEGCGERLDGTWPNLLQIQTVITRRRERINADEEERNRVGFELRTTYRFVPRGNQPGALDGQLLPADGIPLATVFYGDSAEVRVTNLGRRDRKNKNIYGFWLDLVKGRWLTEKEAAQDDEDDEDDLEAGLRDVQRKALVTPYVQDRRNILVLRWAQEVSPEEAITLQFAIERGIEAVFQLEDAELQSEPLPDNRDRGRMLFVEAAEGGAGVLRRLQADPEAFAQVAAEALRIIHINPQTGEEDDDACVRGCYRCLLSYSNQLVHEYIDRRLAVGRLRAMVTATTQSGPASAPPPPADAAGLRLVSPAAAAAQAPPAAPVDAAEPAHELPAAALLNLLQRHGCRLPDRLDAEIQGIRVDMVYDSAPIRSVVILDYEHGQPRDTTPLIFGGWNVIHISAEEDINTAIAANPGVFGGAATP
jgi:hypothetical protein